MAPALSKQEHPAQPGEHQPSALRGGMPCEPLSAIPHEGVRAGLSLSPRSSTAKLNLLFALAIFFLVIAGCKDPNTIEQAQQRGAREGMRDGRKAGDADGYESAYQSAKDAAYDAQVGELYASNNYARKRTYTVIVLSSAFLLGFGLQYIVLYLLRKKEFLLDIDRIVLPKHGTQVNLLHLSDPQWPDDTLILKQANVSSDSTHGK